MKKFKCLLLIGLFSLFIPRVYALSYDINTLSDISVKKGSMIEFNVSIGNIKDTSDGISVCSMNISFDENIVLTSDIRTLGSWSMTTGSMYLFDTGTPVVDKSDIFLIPVKVNDSGFVKLSNIMCSDGVSESQIEDVNIRFNIEDKVNNNDQDNNKPNDNRNDIDEDQDNVMTSNCNLSSIELSEGTIEFDPNVTEYEVKIRNFNDFSVTPKLLDNTSSYIVDKSVTDKGGTVVITVSGTDGSIKTYTIYAIAEDTDVIDDVPKKFNYVPIFIGIIVLLVLVNLIRIIKNSKKNKEQN